jgi:uncharacterized protein (TIGR03435 family)
MTSTFPRPGKQLFLLVLSGLLCAQTPALEKFEVASIKLVPADRAGFTGMSPWGGATFAATNISMPVLVEIAFDITDKQISNIDSLGHDLYDIGAKPENGGALTLQRFRPMLKALLEERFKLTAHRETKDVPGYVLSVAKGGPKLKPGDTAAGQSEINVGRLIGPNATIALFISLLAHPLGKPIVDKTNLTGAYNIDLKFAPDGDTASTRPSIFTAVQEQLGLKLESQKVPFETLVIDHCDHVPTQN